MAQAMHDPKKVSKKSPKKKLFSHTYINIQYLCARKSAQLVRGAKMLVLCRACKNLNMSK